MSRRATAAEYDRDVFINCPFDAEYRALFRALIFTVFECGFRPRCALEAYDAGEVRIEKIVRIIRDCRWGIHDVSRTALNSSGLPRFNMPFELGLFLGAKRYGTGYQRQKSCIVLDQTKYRYQEFISDIAGHDIEAHANDPEKCIKCVRDWLATASVVNQPTPGPNAIHVKFLRFTQELPAICAISDRMEADLTFVEFADAVSSWLRLDQKASAASQATPR